MNWQILYESVKVPARLIVLAIIPILLARLQVIPNLWAELLFVSLTVLDKYLYEMWSTGENKVVTIAGKKYRWTGLAPF